MDVDSAGERGKPGSSELGACGRPPGLSPAPILGLAPLLLETIWLYPSNDCPLPWPQALSQEALPKPQCDLELTSVLPGIPHTPWELVLSLVNTENFLEHHPHVLSWASKPGSAAAPSSVSQVCLVAGAEVGSQAQAEVSRKRSRADRRANSELPLRPQETEPPLSICYHSLRLCFYSPGHKCVQNKKRQVLGKSPPSPPVIL